MEFDKKTIFAFLLIGLILLLIQTEFYQKRFLPQPKPAVSEAVEEAPRQQAAETAQVEKTEEKTLVSEAELRAVEEIENLRDLRGEGEDIVVESNLYKAVFSTRGGTLRSWTLKDYVLEDGSFVQIVNDDGTGNLGVLLPASEDTIDTGTLIFSANKKKIVLNNKRSSDKLEFTLQFDENKRLKKTFVFTQDRYDVSLVIEFENLDKIIEGFSYSLTWRSGLESTEPDFKGDMARAKAYVYQGDDESFDIKKEFEEKEFQNPIDTDWVAIRTKYFTAAVIPESPKGQSVKVTGAQVNVGKDVPWKKYGFDLRMPFIDQRKKKDHFIVYLGPLDYQRVQGYNVGLENVMDLGYAIFRPFGRFILWSFTLLHKVIPNYGFAIIIFSILIKVLLFPLTRKSYRSMKEMQTLQPLMQEINEKYKNDAQKKQQEIMKLYKEHGVNPLGGCIPMLLQMPLLFALFRVFQSTIELRQAPFIWWIKDLSRPDTIATLPFTLPLYGDTVNILPLFMGVTMFIQQKISMKDPKQKAMVYFMPIFLTLLFNSFPSGLNLYYALFNLFSIIQEKLIPYKQKPKTDSRKKTVQRKRRKHDYRRRF